MLAVLALGLLAGATVEVPEGTCTSSTAVADAVHQRIPEEVPLRVTVTSTTGRLAVRIALPRAAPMTRALEVGADDCEVLPELIALIADRYVRALPRRTWAPRAPPKPLPARARASLRKTPETLTPTLTLTVGGAAGATLGSDRSAGLHAELIATLTGEHLGLCLGLGARVLPRLTFAEGGELTVTAGWLELGATGRARLGPLTVRGRLALAAGFAHGEGRGYEAASADTTALLEPVLGADLGLPGGLRLGVQLRARGVGPRFRGPTSGMSQEAAALRGALTLGLTQPVAFF